MKKAFRLLGLSALVLGLAAACNNNQPVEAVVDSIDSVIEEEPIEDVTIDSALMDGEEQAPVVDNNKKTTTTKKAATTTKKEVAAETTPAKEEVKIEANAEVKAETGLDKKATKAKAKLKK